MSRITCQECGAAVTSGHQLCRGCWLKTEPWKKSVATSSTEWFKDEQGILSRRYGDPDLLRCSDN